MRKIVFLLSVFGSLILIGDSCTTYRDVQKVSPKNQNYSKSDPIAQKDLDKIKEGKIIKVSLKTGDELFLKFIAFENDTIKSQIWRDPETEKLVDYEAPFNVLFNSLESVKVSRISWWTFVGGGVGLSAILI